MKYSLFLMYLLHNVVRTKRTVTKYALKLLELRNSFNIFFRVLCDLSQFSLTFNNFTEKICNIYLILTTINTSATVFHIHAHTYVLLRTQIFNF